MNQRNFGSPHNIQLEHFRLDDYRNVKVADFGLSRDIYERDYYSSDDRKAKLPVKWMALESLEKGTYNIKTDVVSMFL